MTAGALEISRPLRLRPRKSKRPHKLPKGWRWLMAGERTKIGDRVCDDRIHPIEIVEGSGWVMTQTCHPVRRRLAA